MTVFSTNNLSKSFNTGMLFEGVSFGMREGDHLGLIGRNGAGKTTLLRIISGNECPDCGEVVFNNNVTKEYLCQNPEFDNGELIIDAVMKSKIHSAKIQETNIYYDGRITIDENLMEKADIIESERVYVVNMNNGARFETYVIIGKRGSGIIALNGPAARLCAEGDNVHILAYAAFDDEELKEFKPIVIILNERNEIVKEK